MFTQRSMRHALALTIGLVPAGLATAQEGDRPRGEGDLPAELRRIEAELRESAEAQRQEAEAQRERVIVRRGQIEAEQRERIEQMQRQLGEMQRRVPGMRQMPLEFFNPQGNPSINVFRFGGPASGGALGLAVRPVPEVLRSHLDLPEGKGLVVDDIAEGNPAADLIEKNDILVKLGEVEIAEPADLDRAFLEGEGETVEVTLYRKGEETTVELKRQRPEAGSEGERYVLGITIDTPDDAVRSQLDLPEGTGVIVMQVSPGSAAEEAGVKPNDLLITLDDEPIAGAEELVELVQESEGEPITLRLRRDGEEVTIEASPVKQAVPPAPPEPPQPPGGLFRYFGPGVVIDPETGAIQPGPEGHRGPGGPGGPGGPPMRFQFQAPASPELESQIGEVLEQLKQLREEVESLKQQRPERPGRRGRDGV